MALDPACMAHHLPRRKGFVLWHGALSVLALTMTLCTPPAAACSTMDRKEPTTEALFARASTVFLAHVMRTEEKSEQVEFLIGNPPMETVVGDFRVLEVFKGRPPVDGKVRDFVYGPGNCSLGLMAGIDYLFFIDNDKYNLVLWPTGSRPFINLNCSDCKQFFDQLRQLRDGAAR